MGIRLERRKGEWIDKLIADKLATVPDQVATKLDFSAWFATLTQRMKQIVKDLALGSSTSEVAEAHGVMPGAQSAS